MTKRRLAFSVTAALLLICTFAYAAVQFIYFAGPIGDQGTFPVLGSSNPVFSSDANHTASQAEYAGGSLYVTSSGSLTATRALVLPLVQGETKDVYNGTTGGQSITVGGASGTVVTIPNASYARVQCPDGSNYVAISGGSSDAGSLTPGGDLDGSSTVQYVVGWEGRTLDPTNFRAPGTNDLPYYNGTKWLTANSVLSGDTTGTAVANANTTTVVSATGAGTNEGDGGGTKLPIVATETCVATTQKYTTCTYLVTTSWSDATTFQTYWQRTMVANTLNHYYITFDADDFSGDGGTPTKSFVSAKLEVHAATDNLPETLLVPQAGSDVAPGTVSMSPLAVTTLDSCSTNNSDAGCVPAGTTTWTFQATMSSTLLKLQAKAVPTTRWPWAGRIVVTEIRSTP